MVSLFVFTLCLLCLIFSGNSAVMTAGTPLVKSKLPSIDQLQTHGRAYLSRKKYQSASYCFSAILQLAQGSLDSEKLRARRQCGLQLAECELELGKDLNAIARCCEVINEAPEVSPVFDESESYVFRDHEEVARLPAGQQVVHDLGKAHFLRGVCLKRIGESKLALQDLQTALQYLPDEMEIHSEISSAETETAEESTVSSVADSPSVTDSAAAEDQDQPQHSAELDEGADLLDEVMLQHPSLVFSSKQLRRLVKQRPSPVVLRPTYPTTHPNTHAPFGLDPFSSAQPPDLSSLLGFNSPMFGADNGETSALSGSGGVGGVTGAISKLISLVPLLCSLAGVAPSTSKSIVDALTTVSKIYAGAQSAYAVVRTYSDKIVLALGAAWLAATVQSYRNL